MKTIQFTISDNNFDTFMSIIKSFKNGFITNLLVTDNLKIEPIPKDDSDYSYIQNEKKVNQKCFSIKEAREKLNL